jgi:hypothetical protein
MWRFNEYYIRTSLGLHPPTTQSYKFYSNLFHMIGAASRTGIWLRWPGWTWPFMVRKNDKISSAVTFSVLPSSTSSPLPSVAMIVSHALSLFKEVPAALSWSRSSTWDICFGPSRFHTLTSVPRAWEKSWISFSFTTQIWSTKPTSTWLYVSGLCTETI